MCASAAFTQTDGVTRAPAARSVHHPSNAHPSRSGAVAGSTYFASVVWESTFVAGVPPFPSKTRSNVFASHQVIGHP